MSSLKSFVICLEKTKHKRCNVNYNSYSKVFKNTIKFQAIDADNININDKNIIHPFTQMTIKNKISDDLFFIQSQGVIGCSLSHINLWKKCIKLNEPIVIIEDDIHFTDEVKKPLIEALRNIPKNADFASLMNIPINIKYEKFNDMWNKINGPRFFGMQVYYITPRGASILLKDSLPIVTHIDHWVGIKANTIKNFNAYILNKRLYSLDKFFKDDLSSISNHDSYNLKRLLPNNNMFYISILFIILLLIIILIVNRKKCFS